MGTRQHYAQHAANLCSGCSCANLTDVALAFHLVKQVTQWSQHSQPVYPGNDRCGNRYNGRSQDKLVNLVRQNKIFPEAEFSILNFQISS